MGFLTILHRWTGGLVGLVLAVIGLSGTLLLWEDSWIALPGADAPYRATTADLVHVVESASAGGRDLAGITFGQDGMALHLAFYRDDGGAYLDQAGRVVDSWSGPWGRPELFLFDLHHHLLAGHTGEQVAGVLGLVLIGFVVTGVILWWRTRKTFALRLWPKRMSRSAIVRHHRDIGLVASPMLLLSALTGVMMLFQPISDFLLAPWASGAKVEVEPPAALTLSEGQKPDWQALLTNAQLAFPDAVPRRLGLPREPGDAITMRLRQDFEWTPNGRSYVWLDPVTAKVIATEDPAAGDRASAIEEALYPVHAGKVGGLLWNLLLTLGGLALTLLGTLATWSFWFRKGDGRPKRPAIAKATPQPAE